MWGLPCGCLELHSRTDDAPKAFVIDVGNVLAHISRTCSGKGVVNCCYAGSHT